jgi:hypothetical protein
VEIRIGVEGRAKLAPILRRAREEGLRMDEDQGSVEMLGGNWTFLDVGKAFLTRCCMNIWQWGPRFFIDIEFARTHVSNAHRAI